MNKIINGRRYDTDAASMCGSYSYSNRSDFHYFSETLFRKRTGEFFLYGEGGAASKYAEAEGLNSWSGGERIMPLTLDEAQKWAEEYLDGDEYEEIFGKIEETETKRTTSFILSESALEKISRIASENRTTKSDVVETAIREYEEKFRTLTT